MSTSMNDDDDESVLDLKDQTQRPPNQPIHQQKVQAWHPILDPVWVIISLFYLSVILIPTGYKIQELADNIVELKETYDPHPTCGIGRNVRAGKVCTVTFTTPQAMKPPILIHYEIENFHQNHRNYYQSRDPYQLYGSRRKQDNIYKQRCEPLNQLGNITLYPCGLIANTFFNDIFELVEGRSERTLDHPFPMELQMIEEDIAWQSDMEYMYRQPEGFCYEPCPPDLGCSDACCAPSKKQTKSSNNHYQAACTDFQDDEDIVWSCSTPYHDTKHKYSSGSSSSGSSSSTTTTTTTTTNTTNTTTTTTTMNTTTTSSTSSSSCFRYYYPNDDSIQYLYETYPEKINPIEGVTNEHFMVWMRIATLPTFRKLYGYIDQPIAANTKVTFNITSNFVVENFQGKKSIVLSTNNIFGGKEYIMAQSFVGMGFFCLVVGICFALKHILRPRRLGDVRHLHYKED